ALTVPLEAFVMCALN
ncbi:DUF1196 domain-containing protein, partial [Vibrio cholerae]|nr:DUF1196 domain-containing protein [Vibrio cholerae]MVC20681.1 DUF1196 domain-containing protein [Vibrio cholerae]MVC24743.1 DUF1196 domain-containing protein [Vibrio cholerae]MVD06233.1 DUF1196 domain-containing protein [Vibrio cholerae]MVE23334.1 DUF1196 domain-containing protein [Vibrio cholerae]